MDAAHQTIVADAEQRESSGAVDGAAAVAGRLDGLEGELGQLAGTLDSLLRGSKAVDEPGQRIAGGPRLVESGAPAAATLVGAQSPLVTAAGTVADPLGSNRGQVAAALDSVLKRDPELSAVWLYDSAGAASPRCHRRPPHPRRPRRQPEDRSRQPPRPPAPRRPGGHAADRLERPRGVGWAQTARPRQGGCGATSTPRRSERARR